MGRRRLQQACRQLQLPTARCPQRSQNAWRGLMAAHRVSNSSQRLRRRLPTACCRPGGSLLQYPELIGHHGRIAAVPGIRAYLESPLRLAKTNGNSLG